MGRKVKKLRVGNILIILDGGETPQDFDADVEILFSSDKLVLVRNRERAWEFPGGHREGQETWWETAVREVREEARVEIAAIEYLGYYILPSEHLTLIMSAECSSIQWVQEAHDQEGVALFERLPSDLSYGDGRELLFVDYARRVKTDPKAI